MGYLLDSIRAMVVTMRGAFREPTTVHYPAEKRVRADRYRNSFALLHDAEGDELCVGCLQCEKICPSEVITVVAEKKESPVTGKRRGYASDFTLDLNACIYCELCVQVCPTDAIVMCRVAETPGYSREELCLSMDRLYENETAKPAAWGTASLLMSMQDPKRGTGEEKKLKGKAAAQAVDAEPKAKTKAAATGDAAPAQAKAAAKLEPTVEPKAKAEPAAAELEPKVAPKARTEPAEPKAEAKHEPKVATDAQGDAAFPPAVGGAASASETPASVSEFGAGTGTAPSPLAPKGLHPDPPAAVKATLGSNPRPALRSDDALDLEWDEVVDAEPADIISSLAPDRSQSTARAAPSPASVAVASRPPPPPSTRPKPPGGGAQTAPRSLPLPSPSARSFSGPKAAPRPPSQKSSLPLPPPPPPAKKS